MLWDAVNHSLALLAVALLALALVNPVWANAVSGWDGFSPLWVVLVVLLLFVGGVARLNYRAFLDADAKAQRQSETEAALDQQRQLVELLDQELTDWKKRYAVSQAQYKVFDQFYKEHGPPSTWR
jgi:membrane protein required for beta-lactamase induction